MESQVSVNCFNKKDVSVNCSCASSDCDFGFAFNDSKFSDRVLKIEIISSLSEETKSDGEGCNRTRKRKREDTGKENGDEGVANNDASWSMDCSTVLRVKTIHISSPILAAKSLFFYKLFSNGMRETEQRDITLRVNASEEAALMEILKFMYSNTLSVTTTPTLVDVLMAADKFEVHSCMRYCGRRLRDLPMTIEFALLYLELPSSVLMAEAVRPLIDAAKDYLVAQYKDFDKIICRFQEKVLKLPLAGIEAVLSSDDLQVASEDSIFDFILKWAEVHYPKLEDRREVLGSRLSRLIRFPFMTCRKLEQVLTCTDFADNLLSKAVIEALFFKAEAPHRQRIRAAKDSTFTYRGFVERQYKLRPVKVLQFEFPRQQCVVYLDLKRDACANLFPLGRVYSQSFDFGGQYFYLTAHCLIDQQSTFHHFGLFLGMRQQKKRDSVSLAVDFEFAARSKPTEKYLSKCKANYTFTSEKEIGVRNVFGIPWETFIAEDSLYFINDTLHLRAELTIEH